MTTRTRAEGALQLELENIRRDLKNFRARRAEVDVEINRLEADEANILAAIDVVVRPAPLTGGDPRNG